MGPGGLAAALAEDHWSVIGRSCQHACERERCVMGSPGLHVPILQPPNAFAGQLMWPGASFPGWLVCTVKVQHDPVPSCFLQEGLVEVHNLFCLVVEEIDLGAGHAESAA